MATKLHHLLASLKDKATLITTTPTSTEIAVLRATPHHPSSSPPSPRHLSVLLSFGHSSRLSAASLIHSLSSRLSSTRDSSVALKSLLCLHHLLSHGSFILVDALTFSLIPTSGRRSPLNLSSFRDPASLALSSWVRWYARLVELLLSAKAFNHSNEDDADRLTSLLNRELIAELNSLVGVVKEINEAPDMLTLERNRLVLEVVWLAEEERDNMQQGIRVRIQEVKERVAELGFADSVELACLFKRLEECRGKLKGCDLFWREVREMREGVERREVKERGRVRRERVAESARIGERVSDECVRFGSSRWIKG